MINPKEFKKEFTKYLKSVNNGYKDEWYATQRDIERIGLENFYDYLNTLTSIPDIETDIDNGEQ